MVLSPTIKLASGHVMPMVALGTWKSAPEETAAAVKAAIRGGYRYLDVANDYANEDVIGVALRELIDAGEIKREEIFVQAKLWNTNHRKEHVKPDLMQTLSDLKLDYVDSFVIHWPQAAPSTGLKPSLRTNGAYPGPSSENSMFPVDEKTGFFCADKECHFVDTWYALEDLVDQGLVHSIGLSNFNRAQCQEILTLKNRKYPVSILQCESHPYLQQKDLIDFCTIHKIAFQAYSPLGSGNTHLGVSQSPSGTIPLKDPFIQSLADKYKKSTAQIMLRWQFQRGVCLVTKSVHADRILSNFDIFDWEIEAEDMLKFNDVNYGWRHLHWRETSHHPDYPFPEELPFNYQLEKAPVVSSSGQKKS